MSTAAATDRRREVEGSSRRDLEEVRVRFGDRKPCRAELERERKLEAIKEKRVIKPIKNKSVIETLFVIVGLRAKMDKDKDKDKEKVTDKAKDSCDSQLKALRRANYENPSPIIANAIPETDFIGIAEAGSGKTAAFVLRMLPCIARLPPGGGDGPYALAVAPTRQRALQIEEEVVRFAYHLGIKVVSIVGRRSMEERGLEIRRGCDVVIATPPLLVDCLRRRYAAFKQCKYVVLDEVDRMIDMGFLSRVTDILLAIMPYAIMSEDREVDDDKRIYMFTTTMPPLFQMLARTYLRNPVVRELNSY